MVLRPAWVGSLLSEAERQRLLDRCARELRKEALLVDSERLLQIVEVQLAAHLGRAGGSVEKAPANERDASTVEASPKARARALLADEDWLRRRLTAAMSHALAIDAERASGEMPIADEDYVFLVDVFFIEPEEAARAAHDFHCLPFESRRAMIELLLFQRSVKECLEAGFAKSDIELGARARQGLMMLMRIDPAMVEAPADGDGSDEEEEQ